MYLQVRRNDALNHKTYARNREQGSLQASRNHLKRLSCLNHMKESAQGAAINVSDRLLRAQGNDSSKQ